MESIAEGMQDELRQCNIENVSIQPGVYATEMNTGEKAGVHAIAQGTDVEFINARAAIKAKWLAAYGN
ncbi:MAG: hypothetical protein ABIN80_26045 [Dyadobacter sp.]|uniref:hypothetical protein n=1 Tax=Dyadobacter sp. TaxID=1914288 RepID=UPI003263ADA0